MNEEHYRRLERMYLGAPINEYYQPRVRIGEGTAEIVIAVEPRMFHAAGAAHGVLYFKAADDAAFFAANSLVEDVFVLTVNLNLYLTRPLTRGEVTARGRVVTRTRSLITGESILTDSDGREVGRATGLFMRGPTPLSSDLGYR